MNGLEKLSRREFLQKTGVASGGLGHRVVGKRVGGALAQPRAGRRTRA